MTLTANVLTDAEANARGVASLTFGVQPGLGGRIPSLLEALGYKSGQGVAVQVIDDIANAPQPLPTTPAAARAAAAQARTLQGYLNLTNWAELLEAHQKLEQQIQDHREPQPMDTYRGAIITAKDAAQIAGVFGAVGVGYAFATEEAAMEAAQMGIAVFSGSATPSGYSTGTGTFGRSIAEFGGYRGPSNNTNFGPRSDDPNQSPPNPPQTPPDSPPEAP